MKRLVLVGGGHSHAIVLERLTRSAKFANTVLVSDTSTSVYSGMLPGLIAGYYSLEETQIDMRSLAIRAEVEFVEASVVAFDLANQQILLDRGAPITFDLLSLNTGSTTDLSCVPGAAEHAVPVKPVEPFLRIWERFVNSGRDGSMRVIIVGGGAAGVELAFAAKTRLGNRTEVTVIQRGEALVPTFPARANTMLLERFARDGIKVILHTEATEVRAHSLALQDGTTVPFDLCLWATGAAPPPWLRLSGLPLDAKGFVRTSSTLQVVGFENVFAVGDVASIVDQERPKSGVFAVRQGAPLFRNLRQVATGHAPTPLRLQATSLSLLGIDEGRALATKGACVVAGRTAWWLKVSIDRKFMARFCPSRLQWRTACVIAAVSMLLAVCSKLYEGPLQAVVRGNAGDSLVVISLYFLLRAAYPKWSRLLTASAVLGLASAVELCQAVGVLNGSLTPTANYWLGHRFDLLDLLAYAIGAAASPAIESLATGRASAPHRGADGE